MISSEQSVSSPTLTVTPQSALVDEQVSIQLSGFAPQQAVTVRAQAKDGALKQWESYAAFVADDQGVIDLSVQKPTAGTYDSVDPMGLFWSMMLKDKKTKDFFTKTKPTPIRVSFTAEVDGKVVASANLERVFAASGVTSTAVQEHGLVGTFFQSATPGPHLGVIILNGSDGGLREHSAALLASRGYAAFALAYFGVEDVPKHLINIPLEYFQTAIHWLQAQPTVIGDKLAMIGLSRGGELALLLGATFPELKAIVAGAPSGLVYSGLSNSMDFSKPAWTYRGEPLPFLSSKLNFFDMLGFFGKFITHTPITYKPGFLKSLKNQAAVEKATIQVEKINGPVLLISGEDDQLWPSTLFAGMVVDRLAKHKHSYPYKHLSYKGVGHFVCFPYGLPFMPPMISLSIGGGMTLDFGGNTVANAAAAADSWPQILTFLEESLQTIAS